MKNKFCQYEPLEWKGNSPVLKIQLGANVESGKKNISFSAVCWRAYQGSLNDLAKLKELTSERPQENSFVTTKSVDVMADSSEDS